MAILTKEQGSVVNSGASGRLQPIDTYSRPAADPGAGNEADQLARALARFSNTMAPFEAEKREQVAKSKEQMFDSWVSNVETDTAGGLSFLASAKKLYPHESPVLQQRLAQAAAVNRLERDLYPTYAEIFSDKATLTDPKLLQAKLDKVKTDYLTKYEGADEFTNAALLNGFTAWSDKIKSAAINPQAEATYNEGVERFGRDTNPALISSQGAVSGASATVGIDPKFTLAIMKSYNPSGDPNARNRYQGQTASGLMDITDGTWHYLVDKYGKQFGVTEDMKNDPRGSALMGAAYAKELYDQVTALKGSPASVGEVNAAYMLGFGGYKSFLEAAKSNPDATMSQILSEKVFSVNGGFFRNKDGSTMTARQAMQKWESAAAGSGTMVATRRFDGAAPFEMSKETFSSVHYKWTDFKNNGEYGGDGRLDGRLVNMLDMVTDQAGLGKLKLTSAYRDPEYNSGVSFTGKKSQHSHGTAIDIDVTGYSDQDRKRLISLFVAAGARGVGHYSNGTIHVDLRSGKGNQPDGMSAWYGRNQPHTAGQSWFAEGLEEGRKMRGEGIVPVAGFNGQAINGFDLRVNEAPKYGMTRKDARDMLFTTLLTQAKNSRDLSVLESIPDGSITPEQRALKQEAAMDIPKLVASDIAAKDTITQKNRMKAMEERETEILELTAQGEVLDADKMATITFKDADGKDVTQRDTKLWDTAMKMNEVDRVDSRTSLSYSLDLSDKLESMYVQNNPGDMFLNFPRIQGLINSNGGNVPDIADVRKAIIYDPNMNKTEKSALLKSLPELENLYTVVQDKPLLDSLNAVNSSVDLYMKTSAAAKFATIRPEVNALFNSLSNDVAKVQRDDYLNKFKAWHKDNPGKTIPSMIKLQYVEESERKAQEFFNKQTALIEKMSSEPVKKPAAANTLFKVGQSVPGYGKVTKVHPNGVVFEQNGKSIVVRNSDLQASGPQLSADAVPVPQSAPAPVEPEAPAPARTPRPESGRGPVIAPQLVPDQDTTDTIIDSLRGFFEGIQQ